MNLFLLCAGEGTRFRPHTLRTPKPAIPFMGIPLACFSLSWAQELKPSRLVINTYHLPDKIKDLFSRIPHGFPQASFSDESPQLMGSGGGIANAAKHFEKSKSFVVMNGDEVFLPKRQGVLHEAYEAHVKKNHFGTLLVKEHPEVGTTFGGVWTDENNRVLGFGKSRIPGSAKGWHFLGTGIYSERLLTKLNPAIASNILYDDLTAAIKSGESIVAFPVEGWWRETGNENDFLQGNKECLEILNSNLPEATFLKTVLNRFALHWELKSESSDQMILMIGQNQISPETRFMGWNVIGGNARLNGKNRIENSVIGFGSIIENANIYNQLIIN